MIQAASVGSFPDGYVDVVCSGKENSTYYVNDLTGTYNWYIPDLDTTILGVNQIVLDWDVPAGNYMIEVEKLSINGCSSEIRDTMVLVSQPEPDLGSDVSICEGESHTFTLTDNYSIYSWQGLYNSPSYTASTTGSVSVWVQDAYGCSASDTTMVTVYENPVIDLGLDTILCGDNTLTLDPGDFASYLWSTDDISSTLTVHAGAGTVSVTVTDEHGCQGADEIIIRDCSPANLLVIPNIFTPNHTDDAMKPGKLKRSIYSLKLIFRCLIVGDVLFTVPMVGIRTTGMVLDRMERTCR